MDDLISRQAAIDAYILHTMDYLVGEKPRRAFTEVLKELPSVQPERKKGKWIDKSGGIEGAWNYCSVCGEQAIDLYDFCPNCGADMRGEE